MGEERLAIRAIPKYLAAEAVADGLPIRHLDGGAQCRPVLGHRRFMPAIVGHKYIINPNDDEYNVVGAALGALRALEVEPVVYITTLVPEGCQELVDQRVPQP